MLAEERFCEILKVVNEKRSVTVQELTEGLNASESTIRRDLTVLHKRGELIKVHGGATAIGMSYHTKDAAVSVRQDLNREDKIKIAVYAAQMIKPNDFIYLDAGTTTDLIIDNIKETNAIFVTNAITHAKKLAIRGFTTYILSGELKKSTEAVVGSDTIRCLEKYNFTKGFFGTNGISFNEGCTTPDMNEALVKSKAMEKCFERYVLSDKSKFNQISPVTFAGFEEVKIITTALEDSIYKKCRNIVEVN